MRFKNFRKVATFAVAFLNNNYRTNEENDKATLSFIFA